MKALEFVVRNKQKKLFHITLIIINVHVKCLCGRSMHITCMLLYVPKILLLHVCTLSRIKYLLHKSDKIMAFTVLSLYES